MTKREVQKKYANYFIRYYVDSNNVHLKNSTITPIIKSISIVVCNLSVSL